MLDWLAQVLVVVTAGWHVLCFDHNLKLLWDRSIRVRPAQLCLFPQMPAQRACAMVLSTKLYSAPPAQCTGCSQVAVLPCTV